MEDLGFPELEIARCSGSFFAMYALTFLINAIIRVEGGNKIQGLCPVVYFN